MDLTFKKDLRFQSVDGFHDTGSSSDFSLKVVLHPKSVFWVSTVTLGQCVWEVGAKKLWTVWIMLVEMFSISDLVSHRTGRNYEKVHREAVQQHSSLPLHCLCPALSLSPLLPLFCTWISILVWSFYWMQGYEIDIDLLTWLSVWEQTSVFFLKCQREFF